MEENKTMEQEPEIQEEEVKAEDTAEAEATETAETEETSVVLSYSKVEPPCTKIVAPSIVLPAKLRLLLLVIA